MKCIADLFRGLLATYLLCLVAHRARPVLAQDFRFDASLPRPVLENYLSRSISFTELRHDDLTQPRNSRGVDPKDNLRLILETKAKFIGRALMWFYFLVTKFVVPPDRTHRKTHKRADCAGRTWGCSPPGTPGPRPGVRSIASPVDRCSSG